MTLSPGSSRSHVGQSGLGSAGPRLIEPSCHLWTTVPFAFLRLVLSKSSRRKLTFPSRLSRLCFGRCLWPRFRLCFRRCLSALPQARWPLLAPASPVSLPSNSSRGEHQERSVGKGFIANVHKQCIQKAISDTFSASKIAIPEASGFTIQMCVQVDTPTILLQPLNYWLLA